MKILLIVPPYLTTDALVAALYPQPLGLVMVGTVLQRAGHEVTLKDFSLPNEVTSVPTPEAFAGKGQHPAYRCYGTPLDDAVAWTIGMAGEYDAVGLYGGQCNIALGGAKAIADAVHLIGTPLVVGGPFVTTAPAEAQRLFRATVMVTGEAEAVAAQAFAWALERADAACPGRIRGEAVELDDLPLPNWDLAPPEDYPKVSGKVRGVLQISRGCPHACSFCSVHTVQGRKHRRLRRARILAQMLALAQRGVRYMCFLDDNLFINNAALENVLACCDEVSRKYPGMRYYVEEGIEVRMAARPGLLARIKEAGFDNVGLGLETMNDATRAAIGKPYQAEHLRAAVAEAEAAGVTPRGFYIVGLPGDTMHSVARDLVRFGTLGLAARPNNMKLYPGTDVEKEFRASGVIEGDYDWRLSSWHTPDQPGLAYAEVRRLKTILGAVGYWAENFGVKLCADDFDAIVLKVAEHGYTLTHDGNGLTLRSRHAYYRDTPFRHGLGLLLMRFGAPGYDVRVLGTNVLTAVPPSMLFDADRVHTALAEALESEGGLY